MKANMKDRLKQAMDYRGLKAVDIVERCKIPKSAVSYYLSGRSEPKNERLYIIAKMLGVSEAWLLGYDVPMERSMEQKDVDELAALSERIKKEAEFKSNLYNY